jgi:hypothetical protein
VADSTPPIRWPVVRVPVSLTPAAGAPGLRLGPLSPGTALHGLSYWHAPTAVAVKHTASALSHATRLAAGRRHSMSTAPQGRTDAAVMI